MGDAPLPDTVATPLLAAELTLQLNDPAAVSTSVAFNSEGVQLAVPSSATLLVNGPAPWVITGATFADPCKGIISDNLATPDDKICVGVLRLVVLPSPSSPLLFRPIDQRLPSVFKIKE